MIIVIVLVWLITWIAEPYVKRSALSGVNDALPDYYELTVDALDLRLIPAGFTATGIRLAIDEAEFNEAGKSSGYFEGNIDTLRVSGLHIFPLIFSEKLNLGRLTIANPFVRWIVSAEKKDTSASASGGSSDPPFKEIKAENMEITNGNFQRHISRSDSAGNLEARDINVAVSDLAIALPAKNLTYDKLAANIAGNSYHTPDGLYEIETRLIQFHSGDSTVRIDSVKVKPLLSEQAFSNAAEYRKDRFDVSIPRISLTSVNFPGATDGKIIELGKIEIVRPVIYIFKDMRLPVSPDPAKLPGAQLKSLGVELSLDSLSIDQGNITYAELKEEETGPGVLTFKKLNAQLENISTLNDDPGHISASASLMGVSTLEARFTYPAGFTADTFNASATLDALQMVRLNPVITGTAFLEIKEGVLKRLDFAFSANGELASGQMEMAYEGLEFDLVTKKGKKKKIQSAIAEMAVVKENPKNGDFRVGEIDFERKDKKSIFNYWWKSLLSGFKSSITRGE